MDVFEFRDRLVSEYVAPGPHDSVKAAVDLKH
jgi:hypothetical protein